MRVLVTGGSGYLGQRTVSQLIARGADVHAVSRSAVDLLAPDTAEALIAAVRPDALVHFAWNATPGEYWTTPENVAWRDATARLARAFFAAGGTHFVGAGTCAEYSWTTGEPLNERRSETRPATLYGQCKIDAWREVAHAAEAAHASAAWGRIFNVFGGDEHPSRLVPSVARSLLRNEPALCTHGEQVRDFLHVDDVADAFATLATQPDVRGPINIASGTPTRVRDLVEGLATRLGHPELVRYGARPMLEPMSITADVSRLRDEVRWRPKITLDQGLEKAARFWRDVVENLGQRDPN